MTVLGLGRDTYCVDSLQPGRTASDAILVGQRFYHDLITPRGTLQGGEEEANFGQDIEELIGADAGAATEREIRSKCERAKANTEKILSMTVAITSATDAAGDVTHTVDVQATTAAGPFRLVLAINDVTVALVGLTSGD